MQFMRGLVAGVCALIMTSQVSANVILDFENPLPNGLLPTSFWQGTSAPTASLVTDQFLSDGLVVSGAALVAGGIGHSASGMNSLAGVDSDGNINYDATVAFSFFQPGNAGIAGTTDYFALGRIKVAGVDIRLRFPRLTWITRFSGKRLLSKTQPSCIHSLLAESVSSIR